MSAITPTPVEETVMDQRVQTQITYPVYYLPGATADDEVRGAEWLRNQPGGRLIRVNHLAPYRDGGLFAAAGDVTIQGDRSEHGPSWFGGAVLLPWPNPKLLDELAWHGDHVTAVCILDNRDEFTRAWLRAHQARHLVMGEALRPDVDTISPVVRIAVKSITAPGHLSDIIGYLDRGRVISGLQLLHKAGYAFTPQAIAEYALTAGCRTGFAAELFEYAQGVLKGKRYRPGSTVHTRKTLALWEEEAAGWSIG